MTSRILTNPPAPGTPEWRGMVSGSKVATILGLSRFQSQYSLWHEMAGLVEPDSRPRDDWDWGHVAEDSLAKWWVHKTPGWQVNAGEVAYTRDDLPFPNIATIDRRARRGRRFHIIECKTARDLNTWGKPGTPDAVPADYYAQVLWQMGVSGIHEASIAVLGFGTPEIHTVQWDHDVFAGIVDVTAAWMQSLKEGTPPPLSDSKADYETVRGLHPDIKENAEVAVDLAQARAWLDAAIAEDAAKEAAQLAKTELAAAMGTAQRAIVHVPGIEEPVKLADRRAAKSGPALYINKKANLNVPDTE